MTHRVSPTARRGGRWGVLAWLVVLGAALLTGCPNSGPPPAQLSAEADNLGPQWRSELFTYAVGNLQHLEDFAPNAMIQQIVERLNQWMSDQTPSGDWDPDPMVAELLTRLANVGPLKDLNRLEFVMMDGASLQEAAWAQSTARWARGDKLDDLTRAQRLFDWTIRNIQLQPDKEGRLPQQPWEAMLLGRGSAMERAWVFALLCRQQGLEAAMLQPVTEKEAAEAPSPIWAVAVCIGQEAYLFDAGLGLPIPAPKGIELGPRGLEIRPASLAQAASDPQVLARLNLDPQQPYPVQSSQAARVRVLLVASPQQLSRRMRLVELQMVGQDKILLTTNPTASAAVWRKLPQVAEVQLWTYPFEVLSRMEAITPKESQERTLEFLPFQAGAAEGLWKGRLLHLKGRLVGEEGATACYQAVRPSNFDLSRTNQMVAQEYLRMNREAAPDRPFQDVKKFALEQAELDRMIRFRAKHNASYWLGLIAYDRGSWDTSIDYLAKRTLGAVVESPWQSGAHYNLGRAYEASGEYAKAVAEYQGLAKTLADRGAALRARWLAAAADLPDEPSPTAAQTKPGGKKPRPAAEPTNAKAEDKPTADKPAKRATPQADAPPTPKSDQREPASKPSHPTP